MQVKKVADGAVLCLFQMDESWLLRSLLDSSLARKKKKKDLFIPLTHTEGLGIYKPTESLLDSTKPYCLGPWRVETS